MDYKKKQKKAMIGYNGLSATYQVDLATAPSGNQPTSCTGHCWAPEMAKKKKKKVPDP